MRRNLRDRLVPALAAETDRTALREAVAQALGVPARAEAAPCLPVARRKVRRVLAK